MRVCMYGCFGMCVTAMQLLRMRGKRMLDLQLAQINTQLAQLLGNGVLFLCDRHKYMCVTELVKRTRANNTAMAVDGNCWTLFCHS